MKMWVPLLWINSTSTAITILPPESLDRYSSQIPAGKLPSCVICTKIVCNDRKILIQKKKLEQMHQKEYLWKSSCYKANKEMRIQCCQWNHTSLELIIPPWIAIRDHSIVKVAKMHREFILQHMYHIMQFIKDNGYNPFVPTHFWILRPKKQRQGTKVHFILHWGISWPIDYNECKLWCNS